ncbi:unnamed protein product [Linum trigynum]|uniref:Pentatricopeptide repeat-containing protein n=1 Tax=Linum trigynum TaxID=586398 RepID=A0AAV2DB04_9ROSI
MIFSRLVRVAATSLSSTVAPSVSSPRNVSFSSAAARNRNFNSPTNRSGNELYRRISPVGDPRVSIVPILDSWIEEGRSVAKQQLVSYIKELRYYGRHYHALEISKWMTDKRHLDLTSRDAAMRLDLIARVNGIKQAEQYFDGLSGQLEGINTYGALVNCYCRAQSVEKAEEIMQKMRDLGIANSILTYNTMLGLYHRVENKEKFDALVKEIDDSGISFDAMTYNILISSYGAVLDVNGMEQILIRMKSNPDVNPDWAVYNNAATIYRKSGMKKKAIEMLEKAEGLITKKKDIQAYYYLITNYAAMGEKSRVVGVWELFKKNGKVLNKGYMDVISSLLKLEDFETAEKIFDEWESQNLSYDVRIPNILIGAYSRSGLMEKAETMVERVIKKAGEPHANSWLNLAIGYLKLGQTYKAMETMKRAVNGSKSGWRPDPRALEDFLGQLKETGVCLEEVKELIQLLTDTNVVPVTVGDRFLMNLPLNGVNA